MAFEKFKHSLVSTVLIFFALVVYSESTADVPKANVIIIGSGPSGIAAGIKLYENRIEDIIWLEAENRIGGRVYTKEFGGSPIDVGAQWCHGQVDNVVYEMAYPLNLLAHSQNNTEVDMPFEFYDSIGALLPTKNMSRANDVLYNLIEESLGNDKRNGTLQNSDYSSLGDYMTQKFEEKLKTDLVVIDKELCQMVFKWFGKAQTASDASDSWYNVSLKGYTDYWLCDGDMDMHWKGKGFKTILDVLMKKIPDPSKALPIENKFHLNKEVINIEWRNSNHVIVTCADGSVYKADYVLVTVSLGVLKDRHRTFFTPELPVTNLKAIQGLGMGTVDKLILEYSSSWWPEDQSEFSFVWHKNDIENIPNKFNGSMEDNSWLTDVFGFSLNEDRPRVLVGWITGVSARKMETLPENEVKEKLIQLLDMFLGSHFNITRPVNFERSTWYENPHFRGSYSYRHVLADQLNTSPTDLAQPLTNDDSRPCVFFAGEATSEHRSSTVHGAIETGWREAERIIQLKKKSRSNLNSPKLRLSVDTATVDILDAEKWISSI